ncbi:MAG: septum formation family protein [Motilibacteraceae bacterium]
MRHRRLVSAGATVLAVGLLGGCSWPWQHSDSTPVSVLEVEVGQCFTPPKQVVDQLSDLQSVPCTSAHTLEAYAAVPYQAQGTASARADYPGDAALTTFADGACAARYADYVGIDYRDSSFFYTYLLPSPRSWQDKDRTVDCFITTTGQPLTSSLKGAKK